MVRVRPLGRGGRGHLSAVRVPDAVLRPALEAAVVVARTGQAASPPVPAPRALRPVLGFTHLPDASLALVRRAVEDDEAFRRQVRDAVDGEVLGRGPWLFLDRPEGWEEELRALSGVARQREEAAERDRSEASAVRRLARAEVALSVLEADLVTARRTAGESGERLAEERRLRRAAETEAGRLRGRIRVLEVVGEDHAVAALRAALAEANAVAARLADELAAAHDRGPEVERAHAPDLAVAGEVEALARAVRRAGVTVTELATALDEAALGLAAGPGVSRSGGKPRGSRRPSDHPGGGTLREPVAPPAGLAEHTVEAAEALLRAPGLVLLIDGYNVSKQVRPGLELAEQRAWLMAAAGGLAARTAVEVQIVFDGAEDTATAPATTPRRAGVLVRYSAADVEADDLLLDLVSAVAPLRPVAVASDDRRVSDGARALGANVLGVSQLAALLR